VDAVRASLRVKIEKDYVCSPAPPRPLFFPPVLGSSFTLIPVHSWSRRLFCSHVFRWLSLSGRSPRERRVAPPFSFSPPFCLIYPYFVPSWLLLLERIPGPVTRTARHRSGIPTDGKSNLLLPAVAIIYHRFFFISIFPPGSYTSFPLLPHFGPTPLRGVGQFSISRSLY